MTYCFADKLLATTFIQWYGKELITSCFTHKMRSCKESNHGITVCYLSPRRFPSDQLTHFIP